MGRFEKKVAFVTGGASGIGFATAKLLSEEGAQVVIGDISWPLAQHSASTIGNSVLAVEFDQGQAESVEKAINFVVEKLGGLDLAVNAASIPGTFGALVDADPKDLATVTSVNLNGNMYCLKYELAAMKRRGGGAIVSIASTTGLRPNAFLGAYSASKAGLLAITKIAAVENGPDGIRVNSVSPGPVDTAMMDARIDRDWLASVTPNRRCGAPSDVADVVAFLLSGEAKHINGSNIVLDGGLIASQVLSIPGF